MGTYNHYVLQGWCGSWRTYPRLGEDDFRDWACQVLSMVWVFFFFYAFTVSLRSLFVLEEKVVLDVKGTISYWTLYSRVHGVADGRLLDLERVIQSLNLTVYIRLHCQVRCRESKLVFFYAFISLVTLHIGGLNSSTDLK
jgi:hypothetical protein